MNAPDGRADAARHAPPRPRRFVLLCQHFFPEMISTGMHMTELAVALRRLEWDITAVCAQPSLLLAEENARVPEEMTHEGVAVHRVGALGSHTSLASRALFAATFSLAALRRVAGLSHQASGVVLTTNPPFLGAAAWVLSRVFRMPYVMIVYDVYPEIAVELGVIRRGGSVARLWERFARAFLNEAAAVVVIGRDMERLVRAKLRPDRQAGVHLIPNWSDDRAVAPVPRAINPFVREHGLEGRFVVQYAGRMGRTHNLEPLVEAAEALREEPIVFQFIGDGAKREELVAFCTARGLTNVAFLPYQPVERLGAALSAADIAVVCLESRFTALSVPSKTYGVMAAGTPILGFLDPESEIGRTIIENDCGTVLRDPTAGEVTDILRRLMADRARLTAMGANARAAYLRGYTLSVAASRYDACLAGAFGTATAR